MTEARAQLFRCGLATDSPEAVNTEPHDLGVPLLPRFAHAVAGRNGDEPAGFGADSTRVRAAAHYALPMKQCLRTLHFFGPGTPRHRYR